MKGLGREGWFSIIWVTLQMLLAPRAGPGCSHRPGAPSGLPRVWQGLKNWGHYLLLPSEQELESDRCSCVGCQWQKQLLKALHRSTRPTKPRVLGAGGSNTCIPSLDRNMVVAL